MDLTPALKDNRDRTQYVLAGLAALLLGTLAGIGLLEIGPIKTLALLGALGAGIAFLRSVWVSFVALIAVVCLLPYAVVPVSTPAGTPTFIELAIFASLAIVAAVVLCDRRLGVPVGMAQSLWLGLIGVVGFAFLLGIGRGYTPQTLHDFGKFLLALGCFALVIVLVRHFRDAALVVWFLLAGTVSAAGLSLVLYAGGPGITERALVRLVPYGYPGSRIVRYIEDDPGRPMRAVGTSVDPNSFGGLLMVGFVLGAGQLFGRSPVVSRWLSGPAVALCGMAMLLTYSRGAWVGAAAGLGVILIVRRRAWLPALGALGVAAVVLGAGAGFVDRLWQGFTLQDPATLLRLQ
ncbi:MAG: O-antigen ligase family protein [Chloroflexia bacterium]|nr:O-antigen ligase family protein [Chloroflexia bacterium]